METITETLEKLKEEAMEVDDSEMYETTIEPTQAEEEFTKEIYRFIQDITKEDTTIACYDFSKMKDYEDYVKEIETKTNGMSKRLIRIDSLYNIQEVINAFRKLFEGNFTITFSSLCGFHYVDLFLMTESLHL